MIKKSRDSILQSSKDVLGGEITFKGTRVPVRTLVDYLKAGDSLDVFLKDFPTVKKRQVIEVLELAKEGLIRR